MDDKKLYAGPQSRQFENRPRKKEIGRNSVENCHAHCLKVVLFHKVNAIFSTPPSLLVPTECPTKLPDWNWTRSLAYAGFRGGDTFSMHWKPSENLLSHNELQLSHGFIEKIRLKILFVSHSVCHAHHIAHTNPDRIPALPSPPPSPPLLNHYHRRRFSFGERLHLKFCAHSVRLNHMMSDRSSSFFI